MYELCALLARSVQSPALRIVAIGGAATLVAGFVVGTWITKSPLPPPPDPKKILADGGKYVVSKDGKRNVEYFVAGSMSPSAIVCILVAGGGLTGRGIALLTDESAQRRNIRIIAVSIPGCGLGTIYHGCNYSDWPSTDVLPVLEEEHVGRFVVAGSSLGTPYAMSIAHAFGPERVLALGVRVPFLPKALSDAAGVKPYCGVTSDSMLHTALPCGWLAHLVMWALFHPRLAGRLDALTHGDAYWRCHSEYPGEMAIVYADKKRAGAHYGHKAMLVNTARSTVLEWGFDPRDIRVRKKLLWYSKDDTDVPPEHGRWLGEQWTGSADEPADVIVHAFDGYGHLGGGCVEWDAFLGELSGLCRAAAPRMASLTRG